MARGGSAALLDALPVHLRERTRVAKQGQATKKPVVYWLRSALRGHESPALDAAITAANALSVPMLVLLHIEDWYPHATARRQMFLLQGAREAKAELESRGIRVHLQVDRSGKRPNLQYDLAGKAGLVVTEEPFCVPWLAGVEDLAAKRFDAPLWLVDCASVVPSALVPKSSCNRAYQFEQGTSRLHAEHVPRPWKDAKLADSGEPGLLTPEQAAGGLDLQQEDLSALIRDMDVDMMVTPVNHTIGGSTPGYERWQRWQDAGGLRSYAKRRNDAMDTEGVSRMSGYLNAGMVSPLRIAREANAAKGAGVQKFLNEFLCWRGLSYAHFYHNPMHSGGATLASLPAWAQETLARHAGERRPTVPRQRLLSANSGDRGWDGMQKYLIETGELHNNARMGWGKAIAWWATTPQEAIDWLCELNNRFALDGHAPPSYGGLLGSLGLYEGPKEETKVMGKVAYKSPKAKYAGMSRLVGSDSFKAQRSAADFFKPTPRRAVLTSRAEAAAKTEGEPAEQGASEEPGRNVKRRWIKKGTGEHPNVIDLLSGA